MENSNTATDYVQKIATVATQLSEDQAAQLYTFARFLLAESRHSADDSASERAAEDAQWEAALVRNADAFAALKAQALADIGAGKTMPMFDERGEFSVE